MGSHSLLNGVFTGHDDLFHTVNRVVLMQQIFLSDLAWRGFETRVVSEIHWVMPGKLVWSRYIHNTIVSDLAGIYLNHPC